MSEIKVTTSELFGYARRLSEIAGEVGNISSRNYRAIQKFNDSCSSFQSWSFISMENQIIEKFTDFIQTLNRGTSTAMNCAYAYEEANTELINSYAGWFDGVEVNTIGGSTEAWEKENGHKEEHNGSNYQVVPYQQYALSQNDPNINHDNYMDCGGVNMGCTITCMAMIWWMMTGEFRDPSEFCKNYNGVNSDISAVWGKGNIDLNWCSGEGNALSMAYDQLSQGKPCLFYANHSNGPHAVVVVGIKEGADPSNLNPNDFLVVDPWDGATKSLSEINYSSNYRVGVYNG